MQKLFAQFNKFFLLNFVPLFPFFLFFLDLILFRLRLLRFFCSSLRYEKSNDHFRRSKRERNDDLFKSWRRSLFISQPLLNRTTFRYKVTERSRGKATKAEVLVPIRPSETLFVRYRNPISFITNSWPATFRNRQENLIETAVSYSVCIPMANNK